MKKILWALPIALIIGGIALFVTACQNKDDEEILTNQITSSRTSEGGNSYSKEILIQNSRECLAKSLSRALKDNTIRNEFIEIHKTIPEGYDGFLLSEYKDKQVFSHNTKTLKQVIVQYINCPDGDVTPPDVVDYLCQNDPLLIIMIHNVEKNYQFNSQDIKVFLPQDNIEKLPSAGFTMPYFINETKLIWNVKAEPTQNVFVIKKSERVKLAQYATGLPQLYSFESCGNNVVVVNYAPPKGPGRPDTRGGGDGAGCEREDILKKEFFEEFYCNDDYEGCCFKGHADFVMHHIWGTVNASGTLTSLHTTASSFDWEEDDYDEKWVTISREIINWNPNGVTNDYPRMKHYLLEDDAGTPIKLKVGIEGILDGTKLEIEIDATDDDETIGESIVDFCDPILSTYTLKTDVKMKPTMKGF